MDDSGNHRGSAAAGNDPVAGNPDLVTGNDGLVRPRWAATDPLLREYYDTEWGMPVRDEQGLYERISLEAFQAGLSWLTILRKRPAFRAAFANFDPDTVAGFDETDVARLLGDPAIVRHRGKIGAAIGNARATVALREENGGLPGGLADLVWSFMPDDTPRPRQLREIPTRTAESLALSRALRARGFRFVGPTTMYALMEAIGIFDPHLVGCFRRGLS